MLLEATEAPDFRNLQGEVSWDSGLNIIFGDNGQGKTNWLEAIYFLATSKSFRTQRLQEAISFGKEMAIVRGRVAHSTEIRRDLQVAIQGTSKTLFVNGKRETVARYLGQLSVVTFTAEELEVTRGSPEARRRFLDKAIVTIHSTYIQTLSDYHRVIKQKRQLLNNISTENIRRSDASRLVESWNEQLVPLGTMIHRRREQYVQSLNQVIEKRLFGSEEITIQYLSSLRDKGDTNDYENLLAEQLEKRLEAEMRSGFVLVGPHRDDLEILFDGRDIKTFGSSGQQRSALITLDLAVILLYYSWHNEYPIFIIDDADAELDRKRISKLLEYLEGRTQTFLTTSKGEVLKEFSSCANLYEVVDGAVRKINRA